MMPRPLLFSSLINLDWVTAERGRDWPSHGPSRGQKTWTFKLRQGVRWSDGVASRPRCRFHLE